MNRVRSIFISIAFTLLPLGISSVTLAQEASDTVVKQGTIKEDLYLAGGTIDMLANVEGDVIAFGGHINIDNQVTGDVIAAGGNVMVRARVGDDVRVAGGNVTISGAVGDDAIAAGGQVLLAPTATVGGRARFAGRSVIVAGKIAKGLHAAASKVVIAGDIGGDVKLYAETVEIQSGAIIRGNLTYSSGNEASIASDAKITGVVIRQPYAGKGEHAAKAFGWVARIGFYISLMLTAIVIYLLFPTASVGSARTLVGSPWKSLGLGFAILAAMPLVIVLLFVSLIGAWLALIALAVYLLLLLLGFLTGMLYIGEVGLRFIGKRTGVTKSWRALSIVAAFIALGIIRFVPVLGGLTVFAALIFGLGAIALYLWRSYTKTA